MSEQPVVKPCIHVPQDVELKISSMCQNCIDKISYIVSDASMDCNRWVHSFGMANLIR
jgi:hypothetical protein